MLAFSPELLHANKATEGLFQLYNEAQVKTQIIFAPEPF